MGLEEGLALEGAKQEVLDCLLGGRVRMALAPSAPIVLYDSIDPGWRGRDLSALLKYRGTDGWGPVPPKHRPGDKYVAIGAALGIAAGAVFGFLINPFLGVLGIIVGGVLGSLVGSLVARGLKKTK